MTWHCSRALAEAFSQANCWDGGQSAQSRSTTIAGESSSSGRKTESLNPSRSGTTSEHLTDVPGAEKWMSSLRAGHAKTSAVQGESTASEDAKADCGKKLPDALAKYDRDSHSWRTAQRSFLEEWEPFSQTWPRWGICLCGVAYRLPALVRRISARDGGFLATPTKTANQGCPSMMRWPGCRRYMRTPNAGSSHWGFMWKELGGTGNSYRGTDFGSRQIHPWEWEWMMGWPRDWTACDVSVMDGFQSWVSSFGGGR